MAAFERSVFGVPVRVHASFFLVAIPAAAWLRSGTPQAMLMLAAITVAVLGACAVQAIWFREFGQRPRIWLHWVGGETFVTPPATMTVPRQVVTYLAAPAVLWAAATLLEPVAAHVRVAGDFAYVLRAWAIVNALPLHPFAGGKALAALLWYVSKKHHLTVAKALSVVVAFGCIVGTFALGLPSIAYAVLWLSVVCNVSGLREAVLTHADARARALIAEAHTELQKRATAAGAVEKARTAHRAASSATVRGEALTAMAWAYVMLGRPDAAEGALEKLPAGLSADPYLVGTIHLQRREHKEALPHLEEAHLRRQSDASASSLARCRVALDRLDDAARLLDEAAAGPHLWEVMMAALFHAGRFEAAAAVGEKWFATEPRARTAFNLGCTFTRLGKPEVALAWLGRAVDHGFRELQELDGDTDLEPLRRLPEWSQLRARLTSLGRATVG